MDIGLNIRNRRKQLHLSQSRLSELSGISQSAISDIENPEVTKRPNTDTIQKIAAALRCKVADLMGEQDQTSANTVFSDLIPDEIDLICSYRELTNQGKEYIKQQMFIALSIYKKRSDLSYVESERIG